MGFIAATIFSKEKYYSSSSKSSENNTAHEHEISFWNINMLESCFIQMKKLSKLFDMLSEALVFLKLTH